MAEENIEQIESIYPLSPMQEGILFHSLESNLYFEQLACAIDGPLDLAAFEHAWQKVTDRHTVLRTSVLWEGLDRPLQVVHRRVKLPLILQDWRGASESEQKERFDAYLIEDLRHMPDLSTAPLMRLTLIRIGEQSYYFIWSRHHLLLDGWSVGLLLKEVFQYYEAYRRGEELELAVPRPYAEYIAWLQRQDRAQAESYWRRALKGFNSPTWLGIERNGEAATNAPARYSEKHIKLSPEASQRLQQQARQHQLTLNTVVQGAWALLLSRYSGSDDVLYGAVVSGRGGEVAGVEQMVGLMINTLPVRVKVSEGEEVWKWLSEQQAEQVEMRQYEYSGLVEVAGWSEVGPGVSLFNSLFVFENYPVDNTRSEQGSTVSIRKLQAIEDTNYPLAVLASPGKRLMLMMNYDERVYEGRAVERMLEHLARLLEEISQKATGRLSEISMLSEAERQQVLEEWNEASCEYPQEASLQELIEEQAERTPEAVAVVDEEGSVTYQELNRKANQLAHYLIKQGVGPEVKVGLCMERSIEMVVGLLAILKAGGAYVPLDPTYPVQRLAFILEDAQVAAVVTSRSIAGILPPHSALNVMVDDHISEIAACSDQNPIGTAAEQNLVYVIYTSGSTGTPKGSLISHQALLNHCLDMVKRYRLENRDRVLQFASISFDLAAEEIFPSLLAGSTVVIRSEEMISSIQAFTEFISRHEISVIDLSSTFWHEWVNELSQGRSTVPGSVRLVIVGSEKALATKYAQWQQAVNQSVEWMNNYGPTEATITATAYKPDADETATAGDSIPIGRPIGNRTAYVLNRNLEPVPVGAVGELYIGGDSLARGYLNQMELTAERFIPNPFSKRMGERLYKTGDLVRYRADGNLEFVGRIDSQVKIRGYRIELGEIESALSEHAAVRQAVVDTRTEAGSEARLAAYVVLDQEQSSTVTQLRSYLKERLPDYMIPSEFVILDELPMTAADKIDRSALTKLSNPRQRAEDSFRAPVMPTEELLSTIWEQVLKTTDFDIHDNFFELGGHSLLAMQLISRLRETFQVEVALRSLFEEPTVAGLARVIEDALKADKRLQAPPIERAPRQHQLPLSFAQQRLWFLAQLEPGNPFYNIPSARRLTGELNVMAFERALNEIVRRHEVLRTSFDSIDGKPIQVINPANALPLPLIDLSELSAQQRGLEETRLANAEARLAFDLAEAPLMRVKLLRTGEREHVVLFVTHHIISDGWSVGILIREVSALYQAYASGKESPLAELPVQYADYAYWQQQWLQGEVLAAELGYWKQQLAGAPAMLELPTDRPRPAMLSHHGDSLPFILPIELSDNLKAVCKQEEVTVYMMLLASFLTLLHHYTGKDDIVIGTTIAGRNKRETEDLIGLFVNTLVLRTDLSGNLRFRELLARVREVTLGAFVHQEVPFEKLVEELQPERSPNRTPLFQVAFVSQNTPMQSTSVSGLTLSPVSFEHSTARFDLTLSIEEVGGRLRGSWMYNTELFEATTIKRMSGHLDTLLHSIVERPDAHLDALEMLTEAEQQERARREQARQESSYQKFLSLKKNTSGSRVTQ